MADLNLPHKMDNEKSVYLDREEHVHRGQLGAKRVVLYVYDANTDTLEPYTSSGGGGGSATSTKQDEQTAVLSLINDNTNSINQLSVVIKNLLQAIADPVTLDRTLNRIRQTAIIESGTVTNVTSLTNQAQVDSYQGKLLVIGQDISAWANVVRGRIT